MKTHMEEDRTRRSEAVHQLDGRLLRLAAMYHPHTLTEFCIGAVFAEDFAFVQEVYETLGREYPNSVVPLYRSLVEGICGIKGEKELLS